MLERLVFSYQNSAKQRESELSAKNLQISSLQQETKDLQLLLSDTRTLLNTNEITVIDLQQQVKHYNETRISLESQVGAMCVRKSSKLIADYLRFVLQVLLSKAVFFVSNPVRLYLCNSMNSLFFAD